MEKVTSRAELKIVQLSSDSSLLDLYYIPLMKSFMLKFSIRCSSSFSINSSTAFVYSQNRKFNQFPFLFNFYKYLGGFCRKTCSFFFANFNIFYLSFTELFHGISSIHLRFNNRFLRERGMASNPKMEDIPGFSLYFPKELSYGYLRFEGNGKIPSNLRYLQLSSFGKYKEKPGIPF